MPGDKSISHRAIILAALAQGRSQINNWLPAGDTLATLELIRELGIMISVEKQSDWAWNLSVTGNGLDGLRPPASPLNCANAGTCMRLMSGILAGQSFPSVLDGSDQIKKRPMNRIIAPLSRMGAQISSNSGRAPLHFEPSPLKGIDYEMPVASAQVKSAVLLAALWADGDTNIRQPGPSRDHTERMLLAMGLRLEIDGRWIRFRRDKLSSPGREDGLSLTPLDLDIPGDISSAAFPLVTALLVSGSQVTIEGVGVNPTRTGLLDVLTEMGAHPEFGHIVEAGGEPRSSVRLQAAPITSCDVSGELVVRTIDELPIWAVAATQAEGTSRLRDATELRVKEVDRITLLAQELRKMGADLVEQPDGLDIKGPSPLVGTIVNSHGDHRLAMALAVAGLVAEATTVVQGADCIKDSYPGFVDTLKRMGAMMVWDNS